MHAATVNPTDTFVTNGTRAKSQQKDPPPYVPGMDVAGVLDEIGEGVTTDLKVGDHVMAIVLPKASHGGYSESLVLPVESVARVPAGASDVEASTLPMNGLTARLALDLLALQPGQTLAVTGAAGCYGGYMVQLAKADGLRVIADASAADEQLVRDLGADIVVPRGKDFADHVRKEFPDGVDAVADGAVMNTLVLPAVKDGGAVAAVRVFEGETERDITIHRCGSASTSRSSRSWTACASRSRTARSRCGWPGRSLPKRRPRPIGSSPPVGPGAASSSPSDARPWRRRRGSPSCGP